MFVFPGARSPGVTVSCVLQSKAPHNFHVKRCMLKNAAAIDAELYNPPGPEPWLTNAGNRRCRLNSAAAIRAAGHSPAALNYDSPPLEATAAG